MRRNCRVVKLLASKVSAVKLLRVEIVVRWTCRVAKLSAVFASIETVCGEIDGGEISIQQKIDGINLLARMTCL